MYAQADLRPCWSHIPHCWKSHSTAHFWLEGSGKVRIWRVSTSNGVDPDLRGGGYSNFFRIRRLGPSIYRSPQKNIRNFKHPKKIFEILATPKNIPILYLGLEKKTLNCIEMTLKQAQFCDDPKKISAKSSYPQNIFIFLKPKKIFKFQNFEPQKMGRAYVCVKISEYHPPWDPD